MQGKPETPEGVATWLMERILQSIGRQLGRREMLDLYIECLDAAWGERACCGEHRPIH